ncbi:MAG: radical SAM protein [bacterium]
MTAIEQPKRILFVRTFKQLQGGGPVPPLGILYLAASVRERFGAAFDIKIMDLGLITMREATESLSKYAPHYVGLSALSCEDDVMHDFAGVVKRNNPDITTIVGGPHAAVAGKTLLEDTNIDYVATGESEQTLVELIESLEGSCDLARVAGIAFRKNGQKIQTTARQFIEDLDTIPFPAWDLIDLRSYSDFPSWVGVLKEDFNAPIFSSRGCPYQCSFCHNIFGKRTRFRSPENVFAEMRMLYEKQDVREFHFFDDIFNINPDRAMKICNLIIESGLQFSLAFPNGLRADIMTKELLALLKKAGTYKIHYGIETVSPRLQKAIGKNLDIPRAAETLRATADTGIITGAYFMVGFPDQTREEIMETIDFAARSRLDAAYFFKAIPYPGSNFYDELAAQGLQKADDTEQHFYAASHSSGGINAAELNIFMLMAQRRFFLNFRRFLRSLIRTPRKMVYLRNTVAMLALVLQGYIFETIFKKTSR